MTMKLHELLAIEADAKGEFDKVAEEARVTFEKKTELFRGHIRSLEMRADERKFEEASGGEHKDISSTVMAKLKYTVKAGKRYFDMLLKKERTNQVAKADLKVGDTVIGTDLPATFLLALESKLKAVREYVNAVPTLDPTLTWVPDPTKGPGIFKAEPDDYKDKAEKQFVYTTIVAATDHHPAQVAKEEKTVIVGRYTAKRWSGMISPADKSELLAKLDALIRATKQARQRANQAEVASGNVGEAIFTYLFGE